MSREWIQLEYMCVEAFNERIEEVDCDRLNEINNSILGQAF